MQSATPATAPSNRGLNVALFSPQRDQLIGLQKSAFLPSPAPVAQEENVSNAGTPIPSTSKVASPVRGGKGAVSRVAARASPLRINKKASPASKRQRGGDVVRRQLKLELQDKQAKIEELQRQVQQLETLSGAQETELGQLRPLVAQTEQLREQLAASDAAVQRFQQQLSTKDTSMHELLLRRESMSARFERQRQHTDEQVSDLEEELDTIKQEFFYSLAISIKLSHSASGTVCNIDTQSLYERALRERVNFCDFPNWIATQAIAEIEQAREKEQQEAQLLQQQRPHPIPKKQANNKSKSLFKRR